MRPPAADSMACMPPAAPGREHLSAVPTRARKRAEAMSGMPSRAVSATSVSLTRDVLQLQCTHLLTATGIPQSNEFHVRCDAARSLMHVVHMRTDVWAPGDRCLPLVTADSESRPTRRLARIPVGRIGCHMQDVIEYMEYSQHIHQSPRPRCRRLQLSQCFRGTCRRGLCSGC